MIGKTPQNIASSVTVARKCQWHDSYLSTIEDIQRKHIYVSRFSWEIGFMLFAVYYLPTFENQSTKHKGRVDKDI